MIKVPLSKCCRCTRTSPRQSWSGRAGADLKGSVSFVLPASLKNFHLQLYSRPPGSSQGAFICTRLDSVQDPLLPAGGDKIQCTSRHVADPSPKLCDRHPRAQGLWLLSLLGFWCCLCLCLVINAPQTPGPEQPGAWRVKDTHSYSQVAWFV